MPPMLLTNDGAALLLDGVTTGAYVLGPDRTGFGRAGLYIVFSETAKGGRVEVETAPHASFAGKWHPIESVPWFAGYRAQYVALRGPYLALRIQVSAVVGGTVSVYGVAQL